MEKKFKKKTWKNLLLNQKKFIMNRNLSVEENTLLRNAKEANKGDYLIEVKDLGESNQPLKFIEEKESGYGYIVLGDMRLSERITEEEALYHVNTMQFKITLTIALFEKLNKYKKEDLIGDIADNK